MRELKKLWNEKYKGVEHTLQQMQNVKTAVTAFNTNIDAVLKISGRRLAELAHQCSLDWKQLNHIEKNSIEEIPDVVKGAFRCFSKGIAEEWLISDLRVFDWLMQNIGYDRLQMGGQGGIVANALAVCGVQKVLNHCNSLPEKQAKLFLPLDNLLSFDEEGNLAPAWKINRSKDIPLMHWIIEFDKGDVFELEDYKISCPKANRFIATYDPMNSNLVRDEHFVDYMDQAKTDVVILSGYHALTAEKNGVFLVENSLPVIKKWQQNGALLHLEIASTQDKIVRKTIVDKVATLADSIGLNERETIDVLEVIGEESLAEICESKINSRNLFEAIMKIKEKVKTKRIQMHMFGLYVTVQDKYFKVSAQRNLEGMCLAATVAASKAACGHINCRENLLWAKNMDVSEIGLRELRLLSEYIQNEKLLTDGIAEYNGYDVIAVPTILVEKPKTLVGMGDTISSISLVGAL